MIIREAIITDVDQIARIHVEGWRIAYAGIVPDEYLASLSYKQSEQIWKEYLSNPANGTSLYVAKEPGVGCVGLAVAGPERTENVSHWGELYACYVFSAYQHTKE